MIVWLASYPRSGSTFFRILLRHLYDFHTYTGFLSWDDLSFVGAGELTGHGQLPPELPQALRQGDRETLATYHDSPEVYFIKSHLMARETRMSEFPAILLVRDVRDVLVSFSWYLIKVQTTYSRAERLTTLLRHPREHAEFLRARVTGRLNDLGLTDWLFRVHLWSLVRTPRWSDLNNDWIDRQRGGAPAVVRFEDLVARPVETVRDALATLGIGQAPKGEHFPDFEELQRVFPAFFREGKIGASRELYSPRLHAKLCQVHGPTMERLGYTL